MIVDIHSHALFGVDDGARNLEASLEMLNLASLQGITHMVLTPHVYSRASRASRDTHIKHYEMLKKRVAEAEIPIAITLGAEINYRSHLKIDYDKHTFEGTKTILIEFSPFETSPVEDVAYNLIKKGYRVVIAHVERYDGYLTEIDYLAIKQIGAYLQVNGSSILGYESKKHKKIIKFLLNEQLIDVIASDCHDPKLRKPDLKNVYDYLLKKHDKAYLDHIFYHNPNNLIRN